MLSPEDETRAVTKVVERLATTFPDAPAGLIQEAVHRSYEQFTGSPIRDFVPVLVERIAKSSLVKKLPS